MYCNKLWATFTNKTASRYLKSSIHKNTHQTPENTDRSKILDKFQWNKVFPFLEYHCNKVWAAFTNWIVSWNGRSSIHKKPSPKSRKHWSQQNTWSIPAKQNFLTSLIRTSTKSELEWVAPSVNSQAVRVCFDKFGTQPSISPFDRFQF